MKKTLELRLTFTVDPEAQARLTPAEAHTLDTAYILFKGLQDRGVPQDPHALETIREIRLRNGLASRPRRMLGPGGPKEARDQAVATRKEEERQAALSAISAHGGNMSAAAKALGISRGLLYVWARRVEPVVKQESVVKQVVSL